MRFVSLQKREDQNIKVEEPRIMSRPCNQNHKNYASALASYAQSFSQLESLEFNNIRWYV